ncbi:ciliary neurotrophic factor receptor subunit alpha-like [Leucoraja erinacea]|uniref:ciliary neurotrophic factor receptor subunit alpha-like n=1 Tax=Leucoraja erinaceus TaxID=7782 RepID=UPI0024565578|nr:ciliary neurotrophic factor receptor subunit alpha-like [Leucoraja erinacea]XP_055488073.1 ciliary neurotrophic factor receptor subunit alpha-like [Leucoraja erinacea]XP_055488083.1 ciliary neurotrophic factor receptor subunit alpha-like [Leucoraja erinacea]XP_055488090.1 ciliary neurotrophic factor receptor subunit alpha-like [Leucoraja erinacea]XP_055488099.1 ciliary neurotrophic factor receptor subunit alpha-like [Leucoraja erinacea]XP_055488105.1 ciliary neurotrophic factor receptor sub
MANLVASAYCVVLVILLVRTRSHSGPDGRKYYKRIGTNVTLPCETSDSHTPVQWRFNGHAIIHNEGHLLQGTNLTLINLDSSHSGTYSCHEKHSGSLKNQITIQVGNSPGQPNVVCRSNAYPDMFYCTWQLASPTYIPTEFDISVRHGDKEIESIKGANHKNRCNIRFPEMFSTSKYTVTVTARNALGSNSSTISFNEISIVKPDPPEIIEVNTIPKSPSRLEVKWRNPQSWPEPDTMPLKYFLRYKPVILNDWQHVEVTDVPFHTITDAYEGKEHIIQVAAKDSEIGTWSEWSKAVHATPWTALASDYKPEENINNVSDILTSTTPSVSANRQNNSPKVELSMILFLGMLMVLFI